MLISSRDVCLTCRERCAMDIWYWKLFLKFNNCFETVSNSRCARKETPHSLKYVLFKCSPSVPWPDLSSLEWKQHMDLKATWTIHDIFQALIRLDLTTVANYFTHNLFKIRSFYVDITDVNPMNFSYWLYNLYELSRQKTEPSGLGEYFFKWITRVNSRAIRGTTDNIPQSVQKMLIIWYFYCRLAAH